jgi:hypothetical protein
MASKTYTFVHVAPIPVGHTVEIKFTVETIGIFKKEEKINETEAIVKDLDTGIIYGLYKHFIDLPGIVGNANNPKELPMEILPNLVIGKIIKGKVIACNLITLMTNSLWRVQTQITIEEE